MAWRASPLVEGSPPRQLTRPRPSGRPMQQDLPAPQLAEGPAAPGDAKDGDAVAPKTVADREGEAPRRPWHHDLKHPGHRPGVADPRELAQALDRMGQPPRHLVRQDLAGVRPVRVPFDDHFSRPPHVLDCEAGELYGDQRRRARGAKTSATSSALAISPASAWRSPSRRWAAHPSCASMYWATASFTR